MYKIDPTARDHKLASSSGAPQSGPQRDGSPAPAGAPAANNRTFDEVLLEALWPCEALALTVRENLEQLQAAAEKLPYGRPRGAILNILRQFRAGDVSDRLDQIQAAFDRIEKEV